MDFVNGRESFLALSNRGALSIHDARFKFARTSHLVSREPWSTVRMEQRTFGEILCLFRNDWSFRWLDVCICTGASEKGFAFADREGGRELLRADKVQEELQPGPSVPGRVRFAPSRRKLVWSVLVRTSM